MRRWPPSHRPRVADSLCSSGRKSGSGRGPRNVTPPHKGYKFWLLREMVGLRPWTFGCFLWGVCSSGRRAQEPLAPFGTSTPAAAARQPVGKYAATKARVYVSVTDTDVLQSRTCLRCPSSFSSPMCTLPYDGIGIAVGVVLLAKSPFPRVHHQVSWLSQRVADSVDKRSR